MISPKFFGSLLMAVMALFFIVGCTESTAPTMLDLAIKRRDTVTVNYNAGEKMLDGYENLLDTSSLRSLFPMPSEFKGADTIVTALFKAVTNEKDGEIDRKKAIELMRQAGYRPANAYEVFHYTTQISLNENELEAYQGYVSIVSLLSKSIQGQEINFGTFMKRGGKEEKKVGEFYVIMKEDYLLGVLIK